MKFFIEEWSSIGWRRVSAAIATLTLANTLMKRLAELHKTDVDNYSIVCET